MQVKHLVLCSTSFRAAHPLAGHPRGARYAGEARAMRVRHVEAQNASDTFCCFSTNFLATHARAARAAQGKRVERECANKCCGLESKCNNSLFSTNFRVTRPPASHLRGARFAGEAHGIQMHQLMSRPKLQVKPFVFLNQFSGDPPAGGSPARCALRGGRAWNANAPTHVEAQNASETTRVSQPVFG